MSSLQQIMQSKNFKKMVIITFFTLSGLIWLGVHIYGRYHTSTDNAYINANAVQISSRITGKVMHLYVKNNQYIHKGDLLFAIDEEPFQLAVNAANAALALSMAELDNAVNTQNRVMNLVKRKFLSPQDGDNAIANYKTAAAKVEQAKVLLSQAQLNLQYAKVTAPTSGWITNFTLRVGDIASANQPLFVLISDEEFWVDANFKETEMASIQPGQAAEIVADMYPNHTFKGVVESISNGAGSVFSLLPPQNATGNWVKVTQRVPVRIHILNPNGRYPLRIGTSATVTIHLKQYLPNKTA